MEKPPFQLTLASVFKAMTVVAVSLAVWIAAPFVAFQAIATFGSLMFAIALIRFFS